MRGKTGWSRLTPKLCVHTQLTLLRFSGIAQWSRSNLKMAVLLGGNTPLGQSEMGRLLAFRDSLFCPTLTCRLNSLDTREQGPKDLDEVGGQTAASVSRLALLFRSSVLSSPLLFFSLLFSILLTHLTLFNRRALRPSPVGTRSKALNLRALKA